jgi:isocitrate dehydrogenase
MMKVSDPIIFGHVVKAYFSELFDTYGKQLAAAGSAPTTASPPSSTDSRSCPRTSAKGVQAAIKKGLEEGPAIGHGRLRQGHHQPARPQRRHRGRLHARHDPQLRPHVGPGRQGSRHPGSAPGQLLRRHLPGVLDDCRANGAFDPTTMGTSRTSASWRRQPKNTAATTRPSRPRSPARSRLSTAPGTS